MKSETPIEIDLETPLYRIVYFWVTIKKKQKGMKIEKNMNENKVWKKKKLKKKTKNV